MTEDEQYSGIVERLQAYDEEQDAACLLMPHLDYESQLMAIVELLNHQREAKKKIAARITKLDALSERTGGEHLVDLWVEHVHQSVFQDAAYSMAAVGMIAPFIESMFGQAFQGIERGVAAATPIPIEHVRWHQSAKDQWNCRYVWKNGRRHTDLVRGIVQLADATGLLAYLPKDVVNTLSALFEYRNKMFHFGFEWPIEERIRFEKHRSGWPRTWFSMSTSDEKPWIFYMSSEFICHGLVTALAIIGGIGKFCTERCYTLDDGISLGISMSESRPTAGSSSPRAPNR